MTDFVIREARRDDMKSIINLCEAHAHFEDSTYDRTNKSAKLEPHLFGFQPTLSCLLLEVNGSIEGYTTFMKEFSTWDAAYYLHMDCLYLTPAARGKGFGRKLMDCVFEKAREWKCVNVQWQTPIENKNAIAFYTKIGATAKSKLRFFNYL